MTTYILCEGVAHEINTTTLATAARCIDVTCHAEQAALEADGFTAWRIKIPGRTVECSVCDQAHVIATEIAKCRRCKLMFALPSDFDSFDGDTACEDCIDEERRREDAGPKNY